MIIDGIANCCFETCKQMERHIAQEPGIEKRLDSDDDASGLMNLGVQNCYVKAPFPCFFSKKKTHLTKLKWPELLSYLSSRLWTPVIHVHGFAPFISCRSRYLLSESTSWSYRSWSWWIRFGVYLWGCHRPCFLLPHCACRKYGDPWFPHVWLFDVLGVQRDLGSETWTLSIVSWISWIGLNYEKFSGTIPIGFSQAVTATSRNNRAAPPCQRFIPAEAQLSRKRPSNKVQPEMTTAEFDSIMGESWEWSGHHNDHVMGCDGISDGSCYLRFVPMVTHDKKKWHDQWSQPSMIIHFHWLFWCECQGSGYWIHSHKMAWFCFLLNHPQQPAVSLAVTTSFARGAWGVARGRSGVAGWQEKPISSPQGQLSIGRFRGVGRSARSSDGKKLGPHSRNWKFCKGFFCCNSRMSLQQKACQERKHIFLHIYIYIYGFLWKQGTPKFTG